MTAPKENGESKTHSNDNYDGSIMEFIERNQIPFSRALLVPLYILHLVSPIARPYTSKFLNTQHVVTEDVSSGLMCDIGYDDIYRVIYWFVVFTFLRSILMEWCFGPFAQHYLKMNKNSKIRFAEQSWSLVYYFASFSYGFYLYYHSKYWYDIDNLYRGWPHDEMTYSFKTYYVASIGFWFNQIFVLNIEKRRKDHYQMFSHHIVTCCLLIGSYYYYYTRIGHLILMLMDCVDIFLSGAKILKYAGWNIACDVMFVMFFVSWICLRHGVYNYLFYHAWTRALPLMDNAKCVEGVIMKRCWSPAVVNTFYGLLLGLQIITIIWMYFIIRVVYRVITGSGADDVRSDSEEDETTTNAAEK